jgi:hypothetical protein
VIGIVFTALVVAAFTTPICLAIVGGIVAVGGVGYTFSNASNSRRERQSAFSTYVGDSAAADNKSQSSVILPTSSLRREGVSSNAAEEGQPLVVKQLPPVSLRSSPRRGETSSNTAHIQTLLDYNKKPNARSNDTDTLEPQMQMPEVLSVLPLKPAYRSEPPAPTVGRHTPTLEEQQDAYEEDEQPELDGSAAPRLI